MSRLGRKLLAVLVLLSGLPLLVSLWVAGSLFERSLGAGLNPKLAVALDDAVSVYGALVKSEKARLEGQAIRLAESRQLAQAAAAGPDALAALLTEIAEAPGVFSVETVGPLAVQVEAPRTRPEGWLSRTLEVPVSGVPEVSGIRLVGGMDGGFLTRFERMEDEVIRPFAALEADRENLAKSYAAAFVAFLALAIAAAAGVAVWVGRRLTQRLNRLRQGMKAVASGQLHTQIPPEGHDELAELALSFNEMARRLADSHERVQYLTQITAWQGIARRLAHEIKNPLTPILLAVQQVHESYRGDEPRYRRLLDTAREVVEQEVHTLKRLVENFSRFAKLPSVTPRPEELGGILRDLAAAHPELSGLTLALPDAPLEAAVDRDLLWQALTNLLQNAAQATNRPEAPLRLGVTPQDDGALFWLEDQGPGVPEAERERIFEPYVTGRAEGTGLGLAIVKKVAVDHGGFVRVLPAPQGGARFELWVPQEAAEPLDAPP